jgi:hypothetical protein
VVIYWGDETSDTLSASSESCQNLALSCLWDGYNPSGGHIYSNYGTYHVTMRYNTGALIWYDATWDVTIPRTTDTYNLSRTGTGFGRVAYVSAAIDGSTACPAACASQLLAGTKVTFTAVANAESAFEKYEGLACGDVRGGCATPCKTNPCTFTMPTVFGYNGGMKVVFTRTDLTPGDHR